MAINRYDVIILLLYFATLLLLTKTQDPRICPSGFELRYDVDSEDLRCAPCHVGFYRTLDVHEECERCPDHYITRRKGAMSVSECDYPLGMRGSCMSGYEWRSNEETCVPCEWGTYRQQGVDYWCVECPENMNTTSGAAISRDLCVPANCPIGTQWDDHYCELCPYGYHGDVEASGCVPCANNYTTIFKGSQSVHDCLQPPASGEVFDSEDCELGTEFVRLELGVACRACAINTYRDNREMPMCAPCPLNTYTLQPGSMRCLTVTQVVELGRFGYRIGDTSDPDLMCPLGTEQGDNACYPCPSGTYRNDTAYRRCQYCELPTIAESGIIFDDRCMRTHEGHTRRSFTTFDCPLGTTWSHSRDVCISCQYGQYKDITGASGCRGCPSGTTTLIRGATSPRMCTLPAVQQEHGIFFDESCPFGSEWIGSLYSCRACPVGYFRNDELLQFCKSCPDINTTLTTGSTHDYLCFVPIEGPEMLAIGSEGCEAGYEPDTGYTTCLPCQIGFYKASLGFDACVACPEVVSYSGPLTPARGSRSGEACYPEISNITTSPEQGPLTGGTELTIRIETAKPLRVTKVVIGDEYPCYLKNIDVAVGMPIHCITSAARTYTSGHVELHLTDLDRVIRSRQHFTYVDDPVVYNVAEPKTIISGGFPVTIEGRNLDVVSTPHLLVQDPNQPVITWRWPCEAQDSSTMICMTQTLLESTNGRRRRRDLSNPTLRSAVMSLPRAGALSDEMPPYPLGLQLDAVSTYRNLPEFVGQNGYLQIYPDPTVDAFSDPDQIMVVNGTLENITFTGSLLNALATESDYTVEVGDCIANISGLSESELNATICQDLPRNTSLPVTVIVGALTFTSGTLFFESQPVTEPPDFNASPGPTQPPVHPTRMYSNKDDDTLKEVVVPILVTLLAIIVIGIIIVLIYRCYRKRHRHKPKITDSSGISIVSNTLLLRNKLTPSPSEEPTLPPLPPSSVYGPQRKTDNGTPMRQLAFPVHYPITIELEDAQRINDLMRYKMEYAGRQSPPY